MYVYLILSNIGNKPLFQWRPGECRHIEGDRWISACAQIE